MILVGMAISRITRTRRESALIIFAALRLCGSKLFSRISKKKFYHGLKDALFITSSEHSRRRMPFFVTLGMDLMNMLASHMKSGHSIAEP
jgi:hypothetical protein